MGKDIGLYTENCLYKCPTEVTLCTLSMRPHQAERDLLGMENVVAPFAVAK